VLTLSGGWVIVARLRRRRLLELPTAQVRPAWRTQRRGITNGTEKET
jgi:hypothetical protein